jgi:cell fate regulator YaaT (PSP1 superfamily)
MPIVPLPVFEQDADPSHRDAMTLEEQHAALEPPKTIVVRFGVMGMVGEYPQNSGIKPGCGSKLVVKTHRGLELAEMLTTTCTNAGCGKSVTRQEMLAYIDQSGGKDFPFYVRGKIIRLATAEDMASDSAINAGKDQMLVKARELVKFYNLDMKMVAADPILGGEVLTFYYMSEDRIDFRELVRDLAAEFRSRIEMRQVGARDEARLVADYERCGQHCCCKNFLKVLKPVSMRSAKVQKATLDPLKISGRCGRLMCCLRYEDQTYKELKANLPHRKTRVGTELGPGIVIDSKILTQLVLIKLEHNNEQIAIPLEELMDPDTCPSPAEIEAKARAAEDAAQRLLNESVARSRAAKKKSKGKSQGNRKGTSSSSSETEGQSGQSGKKKRRRRRRKKTGSSGEVQAGQVQASGEAKSSESGTDSQGGAKKKRRRRRRRSGGGSSQSGGGEASS